MTKSSEPKSQMGAAITVRLSAAGKKDVINGIMDDGTLMVQLAHNLEADPANQALIVFLDVVQEKLLISAGLTQAELNRRRQNGATHRNEP